MPRTRVAPWQLTLAFCASYLAVILALNHFDTQVFVTIGECYSSGTFDIRQGCPPGAENGYDGQYAYYIARDPAHAAPYMDVAAYRYQRILLPLLGYGLSLGRARLVPAIFTLINLGAVAAGVWMLEQLLTALRVSRWFALVYGLFFGVVVAVRLSTAEPLAYGLGIAAIWVIQSQETRPGEPARVWLVGAILLAAVLAKEMMLSFVAGIGLYYVSQGRWRDGWLIGLMVGVPFTIWQIVLYSWLGSFGLGSGGGGASAFEWIPYNGIWRIYTDTQSLKVFGVWGIPVLLIVGLPSLWGIGVTAQRVWHERGRAHLYTWLHLVNAGLFIMIPFSTYREFLGIFRVMVGLVITHILYAARYYPGRRPLIYSTLWIVLILFVVSG